MRDAKARLVAAFRKDKFFTFKRKSKNINKQLKTQNI